MNSSAIPLLRCPDHQGVVASVAGFLYPHGGNILHADKHGDRDSNTFLMRVEFDPADLDLPLSDFSRHFAEIAKNFEMHWRLALSDVRWRAAILVPSTTTAWEAFYIVIRVVNSHATWPASFRIIRTASPLLIFIRFVLPRACG